MSIPFETPLRKKNKTNDFVPLFFTRERDKKIEDIENFIRYVKVPFEASFPFSLSLIPSPFSPSVDFQVCMILLGWQRNMGKRSLRSCRVCV
jgi:hypothetical protein